MIEASLPNPIATDPHSCAGYSGGGRAEFPALAWALGRATSMRFMSEITRTLWASLSPRNRYFPELGLAWRATQALSSARLAAPLLSQTTVGSRYPGFLRLPAQKGLSFRHFPRRDRRLPDQVLYGALRPAELTQHCWRIPSRRARADCFRQNQLAGRDIGLRALGLRSAW